MSTFYNKNEKEDCDLIVRLGKSVWALQQQLELERLYVSRGQSTIRQYEAMTGVRNSKLPDENDKVPDWDYMLKHTTHFDEEKINEP